METQEFAGYWWVPGEEAEKQAGRLIVSSLGDLRLHLIGGFDLSVKTLMGDGAYSIGVAERETPIILGEYDGSKPITLVNCFTTRSTSNFFAADRRPHLHEMYAQHALIGVHLDSPEDAVWSRAYVRFENFSSWLMTGALTHKFDGPDGSREARISKVATESVAVDGWNYSTSVNPRGFAYIATRDEVSLKGDLTASLRIEPPQAVSFGQFDKAIASVADLLTLAAGQPCGVISTVLIHEQPEVHVGRHDERISTAREVTIIGKRVHASDPTAPAVKPRDFRFTCADQSFAAILSNWLPLRERAMAGAGAYFGLSYDPPAFTETRLLTLAVAAEALSRGLRQNEDAKPPFSAEEFRVFREGLLGGIEDEVRKAWVKERLRFAIEPSLKERMQGLVSLPSPEAVGHILSDLDIWAGDVARARNGIAHTGANSDDARIFELGRATDEILALVLMAELGVSASVQERTAAKHQWTY